MRKDKNEDFFIKYNIKWVISISIGTFILAAIFTLLTENSINSLSTFSSFIVLFVIIIVGIVFDMFGIAVTKAEEKPFHSMAAKKIDEARVAIRIIRNAGPVSNFCNDVVGDISGIVSGGIGATLIFRIIQNYGISNRAIVSILMTAIIAGITVGGKAFGKAFALLHYENITYNIAKFINLIEKIFKVKFFSDIKSKNNKKSSKDRR